MYYPTHIHSFCVQEMSTIAQVIGSKLEIAETIMN